MEYWMGIDLGGTKIRAGAVDRNGTVAALRESYTKDAADADRLREAGSWRSIPYREPECVSRE